MDSGPADEIRRKIEVLRLALAAAGGRTWGTRESAQPESDRETDLEADPEGRRDVDRIPGAREVVSDHGRCLIIEKSLEAYSGMESVDGCRIFQAYCAVSEGDRPRSESPHVKLAFLDLETTGLSASPLFLAGTLLVGDGRIRSLQFLARDYSEEKCLISAVDDALKDCDVCITFNGKSFDLPYLKERAKYHRLRLRASPRQIDLLHHARRRWKRSLPNCRLLTLEWYILGRRRIGDVDGWEVPCIYHEFVHTRDARKLKHVLRHNLMDVFSMAQLLISLAEA